MSPNLEVVRGQIDSSIASLLAEFRQVNRKIYENPETAWKETTANETLVSFLKSLKSQDLTVTTGAFGLDTCFEARYESATRKGRRVNFNAEYDALPGLGHACGHNLIAIASLVAFVALQSVVERFGVAGSIQLLGTPAEEEDGGKITLLNAGAYDSCDVSLMAHPSAASDHPEDSTGTAGQKSTALLDLVCTFRGKSAHAGMTPWDGINALDAVVSAYNNIAMLRQQVHPEDRIHGAILEVPKTTNVIPSVATVKYTLRSPLQQGVCQLGEKVRKCLEAAGVATGCGVNIIQKPMYADLRLNETLCRRYTAHMKVLGENVCQYQEGFTGGSTDQGNVSYTVPSLHAYFGIATPRGAGPHSPHFAEASGTDEAFACAVTVGKALALVGWEILTDDTVFKQCVADFERDKTIRTSSVLGK